MAMEAAVAAAATPASLYVGDLHEGVTDAVLLEAFADFKSLDSVRVCLDSSTGRSLGYGYVNFISPEDALRAMELKNHSTLNGKVIRVMWSHRDSNGRRSGVGNVFVKNLSDSIDSGKLQDMFQKFGDIISCKVVTSEDGKSRGYGFVQFGSEDSAQAAIAKLNGSVDGGKQMYVGKFLKKSERALPSQEVKYTNLYVKNLDTGISEEVLKEKFSQHGKIVSLVISRDENGASKGFGFVNFDQAEDAKSAVQALHGSQLGSKILYVARAQKKSERDEMLRRQFEEKRKERILKYQASNVYVKNIDDDISDDELRLHFSQCGEITSAKIMRDDKGVSKGFGFVCFSSPDEANKAVYAFHGFILRKKPLYVAIAQRKEERQMQLQVLYGQRVAGLSGPPSPVIPGGYSPLYYPTPGVVSPQPNLIYQQAGIRPGWRPNAIPTFALLINSFRRGYVMALAGKLIVDALKLGATHLNLELPSPQFRLPREVLNSKTLLQLSVKGCGIDGSVECPMLKSLTLDRVILSNDDMISDIISCCVSIEEISLSNPSNSMVRKLGLSVENRYELHKLKRLYLEMVNVDNSFFENFGSRFPCLNDLSLVNCDGYNRVHISISSTSLQSISIVQGKTLRAEFDVPNLAHFSFGGKSIPSITIEAKEWDSSISINCKRSHTSAWYLALLKMLTKLSSSRISLSLNYPIGMCWDTIDDEVDFELPSKPVAVENLTIEAPFDYGHYLLAGLFWICQPKFVTHCWLPQDSCKHWLKNNESLNHVCEHLSEEAIDMDVYDREYNLFGRFDIEKVNVEVFEEVLTGWKPLLLKEPIDALMAPPNKRKVRFGLKWTAGISFQRI